MRPEREIIWACSIYESEYTIDKLNLKSAIPGCLKDFEIIVGCGSNNTEFSRWFKELIKLRIVEFTGKINKGMRNNVLSDGYIFVGAKLINYLDKNSNTKKLWETIKKSVNRDRII